MKSLNQYKFKAIIGTVFLAFLIAACGSEPTYLAQSANGKNASSQGDLDTNPLEDLPVNWRFDEDATALFSDVRSTTVTVLIHAEGQTAACAPRLEIIYQRDEMFWLQVVDAVPLETAFTIEAAAEVIAVNHMNLSLFCGEELIDSMRKENQWQRPVAPPSNTLGDLG